jgi:phage terminase large subunit GpA-like protein
MDAITDPSVLEIWCMKSKQVGWSEVLLNAVGYFVDQDPSPIMMVQPTLEMAESFSKQRVAPMVRDTAALRMKIADPRSRDSGNTLREKNFPGGHLTLVGANSAAGLASRPIRILLCDEVDKYPETAGASGDPISLARDRQQTFWNRRMLAGSTPTIKGRSRVESGFETSDQRYAYYPCPHCREYQRLVWVQVKWTEYNLAPKKAVYQCVHCGEAISNSERLQMLPLVEWRASKPFNGIAGFHFNEIMSPFSSLGEMAEAWVIAKKLPNTLQSFINERLGETWEDKAMTVRPEGLLQRREPYSSEPVPADVAMLTIGVDTQDDRLEGTLLGWGRDEECWVLHHKIIRGDPGVAPTKGVWKELTEYRQQRFITEDGRTLLVQGVGVDFGGHFSQHVANYAYRYRFQRVYAVRGIGGTGKLAWPRRPGKTKLSKADIYSVGVDTIKDVLYGRLAKITQPDPGEPKAGYIHLPMSVDEEWCEQLISETKIYKKAVGRRVAVWRPKRLGVRQEAQDCWNYGYAVMLGRNIDLAKLADAIERRREGKSGGEPESKPRQRQKAATPKDKLSTTKKGRRKRRVVRSKYLTRK